MKVSNLINQSRRNSELPPQSAASLPSQRSGHEEARSPVGQASVVAANTYQKALGPAHRYPETPQPPPTPPVEEARCSLPSISSLFSSADGGSPSPSGPGQEGGSSRRSRLAGVLTVDTVDRPRLGHSRAGSDHQLGGHSRHGHGHGHGHGHSHSQPVPRSHSRVMLPPSPPLRPDSGFDGDQSPSTSSQYSSFSAPPHYSDHAMSSVESSSTHRPPTSSAGSAQRPAAPPSVSSYESSPERHSYHSPHQYPTSLPSKAGTYQHSLPQSFPPTNVPVPPAAAASESPAGSTNPWQHHHYISPSSQAAFPPSQDRYICQTCSKAFSRPSSLRIHSHSHTGEKPFKCPHHGCGKAFSVRSNMKRHERGCHSGSPSSPI